MALTTVQHNDKSETDKTETETDKTETESAEEVTITPPNGNPK